ncbi:MAG: hypothetical protein K2H76_01060, partial [Muribaculaceae bacterium]|nr:hypothetical protein [Muribaculaceae bacterium]
AFILPVLRTASALKSSALGCFSFLFPSFIPEFFIYWNFNYPSGELSGASLHGERAERTQKFSSLKRFIP